MRLVYSEVVHDWVNVDLLSLTGRYQAPSRKHRRDQTDTTLLSEAMTETYEKKHTHCPFSNQQYVPYFHEFEKYKTW